MQAIIKNGFNNWYLDTAGRIPEFVGENALVTIVSINEHGAIVDSGLVHTFVPSKFIELQGVSNEIKEVLTSAWQANQPE